MGYRRDHPSSLWAPGGKAKPGKDETDTAIRETREETGRELARDQLIGPVRARFNRRGSTEHATIFV